MSHAKLVAALGIALLPQLALAEERVLVQDLAAHGLELQAAAALSTATCNQLAQRKAYEVLCGDDLRALIQWNALAVSFDGCRDQHCYESAGKALEAGLIISGSVAKVGSDYILSLSLFDVRKARALGRGEAKAGSIESLYKQVGQAVDQLLAGRKP